MDRGNLIRLSGHPDAWSWMHWVGVFLSLGLVLVNLYIGYTEELTPLLVVGLSFLLGVLLFVSRFWNPVLYLIGILHIGVLGVLWLLDGRQFPAFGAVTGILSIGLAAIALRLFVEEGMDSSN